MSVVWVDKLKIKKNIYKYIENSSDKQFVYLPNFTHGLTWKNTKILSSSSELKTNNNEGIFENYIEKLDDNSINIVCNSFKNETQFKSNPIFQIIRQEQEGQVNWYGITDELKNGITIYTNRVISIYFNIVGVILANSTYTPLNVSVYCNNKLLKTFTEIPKFDIFYLSYLSSFHAMFMAGAYMYVEPIEGKCFIQLKQEGEHGQANMIMTQSQLDISYIDSEKKISTVNDIHLIAYEEK